MSSPPAGPTKLCVGCNKILSRDQFQRRGATPPRGRCRPCENERFRAWLAKQPAEWKRARYRENSRRSAAWALRNPDRVNTIQHARERVKGAIRTGELIRPASCEECGKRCKPDAAHSDYSQPLAVKWLCRSCHVKWDQESPKTRAA